MKTAARKPISKFSRNLARLRTERGVTQEKLAELVDVHPRYIQKLEGGTALPSFIVLGRLKMSLGCSWDELLAGIP